MTTHIEPLNPDGVPRHPALTQPVVIAGAHRSVYVSEQHAVTADGTIVGRGDITALTAQALQNPTRALGAARAALADVVKWTVYLVRRHPLDLAFGAFQRAWAGRPHPPAVTVVYAVGLANPDYLVDVDAVAAVPTGIETGRPAAPDLIREAP